MLRKFFKLLSGPALGQIITVILTPFFMFVYSPEEFGVLGFYIAVISVLLNISCFRFDAVLLACNDDEVKTLYGMGWFATLLFQIAVILVSVIFHYNMWFYLSIGLLAQTALLLLSSLLLRQDKHLIVSMFRFIFVTAIPLFQLLFSLCSVPNGLMIGYASASFLLLVILVLYITIFYKWETNTRKSYSLMFNKYKGFFTKNLLSIALNSVSSQFLPLSVKLIFGDYTLGIISIFQRLFTTPANFILRIIMQVYNRELAVHLRNNNLRAAKSLFIKTSSICFSLVSLFALVVTVLFATILPLFNKSGDWDMLSEYFPPLLLFLLVQGCSVPVSQSLTYLLEHKAQLVIESSRFMSLAVLLIFSYFMTISDGQFVNFYVISQSAFYLVLLFTILNKINVRGKHVY